MPLIVRFAIGGFLFFVGWTAVLLVLTFARWLYAKWSEVLDGAAIEIK